MVRHTWIPTPASSTPGELSPPLALVSSSVSENNKTEHWGASVRIKWINVNTLLPLIYFQISIMPFFSLFQSIYPKHVSISLKKKCLSNIFIFRFANLTNLVLFLGDTHLAGHRWPGGAWDGLCSRAAYSLDGRADLRQGKQQQCSSTTPLTGVVLKKVSLLWQEGGVYIGGGAGKASLSRFLFSLLDLLKVFTIQPTFRK